MFSREFIEKIPKTDLHLHLDGSIRLKTLIELAKEYRVNLPSYEEAGLKELVFKDAYASLNDYLKGFAYTGAVLQNEPSLERVAYELGKDNQAEGVRYIEVRFAPQLHVHRHLNSISVLKAVARGLDRAKAEFNNRKEVRDGLEPEFEYGIIVCAMRMFGKGFSEYYTDLLNVLSHSEPRSVFALASQELVKLSVEARDKYGLPIVGLDLAGAEDGYPADDHIGAFSLAHKNFMKKTVHAGEAYGPESIFQAITDCHADRIGHGYYLFEQSMIKDGAVDDKEEYIKKLVEYIADRRITIEVCLTSNLQTNPAIKDLSQHSFKYMREAKLSTSFCTDNRTVSSTTVSNEIEKAIKYFELTPRELKHLVIYGFKRSFFPGSYIEKRDYVRRVIDFYEKLEAEYEIQKV
ncbi:adenosine deaminase family protein [Myxococcota bacterium]|nr:adenosine deaminase family protein [Myxococcota bacterium]MBU1382683.1 adenosine deaminase family protein [Myxococcota bacterium]MBU1497706.1 adenosine deaminase family protein [Myxococcota bacterium]